MPLKKGRPTKKNGGKAGSRTQATTQVADMQRVGVWKHKLGLMDAELRHDKGQTWSYDAIRLLLFMVVKGIQESVYTTWQGAKEAITSSIGMVHRVSGCGVSTLKERGAHYSKHGDILIGDSSRRGNASAPLVEDLRQLSPAHYAEVRAIDDARRDVTRATRARAWFRRMTTSDAIIHSSLPQTVDSKMTMAALVGS